MLIDPNRLTSQSLLGRLVRLPLRLVPPAAKVRVLGGPNKGARWRAGSSVAGCWTGTYEAPKVRRVCQALRAGMTAWDIGANAGYYTLVFSRLVGGSGRVVAFEPFAVNSRNLLDHISWNGCGNVQLVQAAVSDVVGVSGFEVAGLNNSMVHLGHGAGQYLVPTVTLDQCAGALGLAAPDIVKMDIEGAEVHALRGAKAVLAANRTTWFVSLHGLEAVAGCGEIFRAAGYRLTDLAGNPLLDDLRAFPGDEFVALPPTAASRNAT